MIWYITKVNMLLNKIINQLINFLEAKKQNEFESHWEFSLKNILGYVSKLLFFW